MTKPKTTGRFETREELEEEVVNLRKNGATYRTIGNKVGVHTASVPNILRSMGYEWEYRDSVIWTEKVTK